MYRNYWRKNSNIFKACDVFLDSSVDRESCPLNLAPTTSTSVSLAIGDALATVWIEEKMYQKRLCQ